MDPRLSDPSIFAGLYNLGCERLHELRYTLTSVLISPAAENVFAQVIDGKPISQSPVNHLGKRSKGLLDSHHSKPSDLAIQQYGKIRTSLNLSVLEVDKNVYRSLVISYSNTNGDVANPAIPECRGEKPRA